jgi:HlyD family secretion protein
MRIIARYPNRRAHARPFAAVVVALLLAAGGCHKKTDQAASIATGTVTSQDVTVTVEATGVIDPRGAVQVKSKASGQIVKMPIEVGDHVKEGQLLVQIDPRQVQSQYDEAAAAVNSAKQTLAVATAQRQRADQLFSQRVMTVTEHETALTAEANAQAGLASAQTNFILASISLADVTIRAPIAGTVIDKSVSAGQVISSATGNVSGGTTLLTLANLNNILDSALVNESDIGRVQPGQSASVTVDAYPGRTFHGTVERVAPEATVQQSVTMFPVLIGLDNQEGLLKPGMNSDVTILIQQVTNVLTVPNDAITTTRDAPSAATTLGVDPASVQQLLGTKQDTSAGVGGTRSRADSGGASSRTRAGRSTAPRRGVVFVAKDSTFVPRLVTLGASNYDVTQILSGVKNGERVALLSAAMLQQARNSMLNNIRSRSALPGMGSAATPPRTTGAGTGGAPSGGTQGGGRSTGGPRSP